MLTNQFLKTKHDIHHLPQKDLMDSKDYMQPYNEVKSGPLSPHYTITCNITLQKCNLS